MCKVIAWSFIPASANDMMSSLWMGGGDWKAPAAGDGLAPVAANCLFLIERHFDEAEERETQ